MIRCEISISDVVYLPAASARSDNDIFVAVKINSKSEGGEGRKRADYLLETHCYEQMLISSISIQAKPRKNGVTDHLLGIIRND